MKTKKRGTRKIKIELFEIDLKKGDGHNHPDINCHSEYMVKVGGRLEMGIYKNNKSPIYVI